MRSLLRFKASKAESVVNYNSPPQAEQRQRTAIMGFGAKVWPYGLNRSRTYPDLVRHPGSDELESPHKSLKRSSLDLSDQLPAVWPFGYMG